MLIVLLMATHTTVTVTDDMDGSANAETVGFGFRGATYEIDLSPKNQRAFEKALKPYIDAARTARGVRPRQRQQGSSRRDLAMIREWAGKNGYEVSDKGRVPRAVVEAYDASR